MKDVIITGGRDYVDFETIKKILSLFDIGLLIQGGASGADKLAKYYAIDNNIPYETVLADWDKYDKAAGPIRNKEMLDRYPNAIVLAFPGGRGTENCIKQALELKRIVLRVEK